MELTEINTEIEIVKNKRNTNKLLLIKIDSVDTPHIFNKIIELYDFIKSKIIFKDNYYYYTIKKPTYKITITMKTQKKILNYILTYQTIYDIIK
jgi:hypothetical protein